MRHEVFWSLIVHQVFITLYISNLPLSQCLCALYEDTP